MELLVNLRVPDVFNINRHVMAWISIIIILTPLAIILTFDYIRVLRLRRHLPPGPFPLPLFGNHFSIPKVKPWIAWEHWARYYDNPMITVWVGNRPNIICNDAWTISDLCEKRAAIYSSRPYMPVMCDLTGLSETNQTCLEYGDKWRLHRRLMHTAVGSQAVRAHRHFQSPEGKLLMRDLLEMPDSYVMSIERYSCSVASIVGWGRRIDKVDDIVARAALAAMEVVDLVIPTQFIVDTIPWLSKLPAWIWSWPSTTNKTSMQIQRFFYNLSQEAAGKPDDGEGNLSKRMFDHKEAQGLSDLEIAALTSNLIGGGVDTTSSTLLSCILALIAFPETQRKAQEELDSVVGRDRSPQWEDFDSGSLPYITALTNEVLRWRTVTILGGIPHAPTRDDVYRGYLIPKGTNITGNVWAIHRHPREFPDPDRFRPERFLNGLERPYPNAKGHNAFGWGRRQCSGQPLAEQGLLMTIARMLWAFDVQPGVHGNGNPFRPDIFAYTKSENMRPEPFPARFVPRTPEIEELVRMEAKMAREELRRYDGETRVTMAGMA